uniref:Uncharacterized protein n=1 Tax=Candidatus Kentrum sp. LPFa TaxID=2126335 RepID=A0A450WCU0_9GAMM|nr:MAG: hypothetical protein BECKLPF1236B_GA0070989_106910 [Candidatus Kentron sp. LPFa]
MNPFLRIAELFIRELFWGLRTGAQHRYLVLGLALGLMLLLLLAIGLSILHVRVYDTILGQAGGPRIWMDSSIPLTPEESETRSPLRLMDGRPLYIYPYTDITPKKLALSGKRNTNFRGRIIPPNHPLRKVLQPVAGDRDAVLSLGFLGDSKTPIQPPKDASSLYESPQTVIYLSLRALPAIDWQAQMDRAPAFLKSDYRILRKLAEDRCFSASLQTPDGVAFLYGETDKESPNMARECGKSGANDRKTFLDWREQLIAGGNRRSGLFLATGEWIRIIWVRGIPLPGGFDYLVDFEFGQALRLRSQTNRDTSGSCRANPGSKYDEVYLRSGAEPLAPEKLYPCLDPCFGKGAPHCRVEDTPYGEQKLTGPHLYLAWLMACPVLKNRLRDISPGNQSPAVRACAGFEVHQADVYLPEYSVLPEAERLLKKEWGMRPGTEARDALIRVSELLKTLDNLEWTGLVALLVYLGVVLISLQYNLARRRQGTLGQLRAHGLRGKYILFGGGVADLLSWVLSFGFALVIVAAVTFFALDAKQAGEHYMRGIMDMSMWLPVSLVLHLSAGAFIHWWRILRLDPGENLSAVE